MIAIEEFAETDSPSEGLRRTASLTRAEEGCRKRSGAPQAERQALNEEIPHIDLKSTPFPVRCPLISWA